MKIDTKTEVLQKLIFSGLKEIRISDCSFYNGMFKNMEFSVPDHHFEFRYLSREALKEIYEVLGAVIDVSTDEPNTKGIKTTQSDEERKSESRLLRPTYNVEE
jgi:hypothetical protein